MTENSNLGDKQVMLGTYSQDCLMLAFRTRTGLNDEPDTAKVTGGRGA